MLDHLLVDLIAAIQDSFDRALLERQAVEERFQVDVFLGDVTWETSYSLPGEDQPPRVRTDLSIDWPTWSQASYRSWTIGEPPGEMPEAVVEVAMRIQRLAQAPATDRVTATFPAESPPLGSDPLVRTAIAIEEVRPDTGTQGAPSQWAVEAGYEGRIRFDEGQLEDPASIGPIADALARWAASTLVQLADLDLEFLPPDPPDADAPAFG